MVRERRQREKNGEEEGDSGDAEVAGCRSSRRDALAAPSASTSSAMRGGGFNGVKRGNPAWLSSARSSVPVAGMEQPSITLPAVTVEKTQVSSSSDTSCNTRAGDGRD